MCSAPPTLLLLIGALISAGSELSVADTRAARLLASLGSDIFRDFVIDKRLNELSDPFCCSDIGEGLRVGMVAAAEMRRGIGNSKVGSGPLTS